MFVLARFKDTITFSPKVFGHKFETIVQQSLNKKFSNKVILKVGLGIVLWDVLHYGDPHIFPGSECFHVKVLFRYVVFRPFIDEILVGKVKSSDQSGIKVTIGFFDDIFIPANSLAEPSGFDETEQLWYWNYDAGNDTFHKLYFELGEAIRFRVCEEIFTDTVPTTIESADEAASNSQATMCKLSPYSLICSTCESGLGLLTWWENG